MSYTRLDRIRAFAQFVNAESHVFVKFASHPGFCIQQAYNSANSGPVASAAEAIINNEVDNVFLLQLPSNRPNYNPHPALLRTLEVHTGEIFSVSIIPGSMRGTHLTGS